MYEYRAPRRDMQFVLHDVLGAEAGLAALGRADLNRELIDGIMEEGTKFAEEVLSPLNWQGDHEGAVWENGNVRTPKGYKGAFDAFTSAGWTGTHSPEDYGGQNLPYLASIAAGESFVAGAMAWRMSTGLTEGAVASLHHGGAEAQKAMFLPKMVSGEWTGTMCLTEPHCGTDLGLMRTRAVPTSEGTYKVSGTKIFISFGEHDLTENIVHLVLAKLPDAPSGTRGISLFVVPKRKVNADGTLGERNGVNCERIEHKMGIHGSPTCVMRFEDAEGWLVGAPHGGLAVMFIMMNHARLGVALQGLALAERAWQAAAAYSVDRIQGRSLRGPQFAEKPADPLHVHPDVRRMLLTIRALVEGGRVLLYQGYQWQDALDRHPDPAVRKAMEPLVGFLVPIAKAFLTDMAMEATGLAVQVHGGHGFIRDTGVEQLMRDAKITCLYEGTNGVQALDLMGRKVMGTGGASVRAILMEMQRSMESAGAAAGAVPVAYTAEVRRLGQELGELTAMVAAKAPADAAEIGAASHDYLNHAAYTLLAWSWWRTLAALPADADPDWAAGKRATARFFFERLVPRAAAHAAAVRVGAGSLMDVPAAALLG
jgi:alkylation response protein AidB-like acyl-CoA dehydrogenase